MSNTHIRDTIGPLQLLLGHKGVHNIPRESEGHPEAQRRTNVGEAPGPPEWCRLFSHALWRSKSGVDSGVALWQGAPVDVALASLEAHPDASQEWDDIVLYCLSCFSQYHSGDRVLLLARALALSGVAHARSQPPPQRGAAPARFTARPLAQPLLPKDTISFLTGYIGPRCMRDTSAKL